MGWNTEATASKIFHKFPQSLVFIMRPSRMHLKTFAVYSNFVETNDFGNPSHCSDFGSVHHLSVLYSSAIKELQCKTGREDIVENVPIRLIGFSKGCIVLNQIIFELPTIEEDQCLQAFLTKIKYFYWLDGGHSGGGETTWITDETSLTHLAMLQAHIEI